MTKETIAYRTDEGIALIAIDDGKANAMQEAFFDGVNGALDQAERDGSKAVISAGRDGFFSAGLDLKTLPTLGPEDFGRTIRKFVETLKRVFLFPKPVVGAATGHAIAGGALLLLSCDRKLCAAGPYKIGLNETAIGLVLPSLAIEIARASINPQNETRAMLHAEVCPPEVALEIGFLDRIVPSERLLDEAKAEARRLGAFHGDVYAEAKRRLRAERVEHALAKWKEESGGRRGLLAGIGSSV